MFDIWMRISTSVKVQQKGVSKNDDHDQEDFKPDIIQTVSSSDSGQIPDLPTSKTNNKYWSKKNDFSVIVNIGYMGVANMKKNVNSTIITYDCFLKPFDEDEI